MKEAINKQNIFIQLLLWHFMEMPKEIVLVWKNILLFNLNFFSVSLLLKTFFSPWRRYGMGYTGRGFNPGKYIETFFSNLIFRLFGALIRSFLILTGIIIEAFIFALGLVLTVAWVLLPVIIIGGFFFGLKVLF